MEASSGFVKDKTPQKIKYIIYMQKKKKKKKKKKK